MHLAVDNIQIQDRWREVYMQTITQFVARRSW